MLDIFDLLKEIQGYNNGIVTSSGLIITILTILGMWRIFQKAGKSGWKSIIPIYNMFVYCKIVKLNFWIFLISLVCVFIPFIQIIAILYIIYFAFAINFRLSRAFGHGFLFGLGLCFFNTIFILILGFNSDEYQLKK